jgi:hypothetical protein
VKKRRRERRDRWGFDQHLAYPRLVAFASLVQALAFALPAILSDARDIKALSVFGISKTAQFRSA